MSKTKQVVSAAALLVLAIAFLGAARCAVLLDGVVVAVADNRQAAQFQVEKQLAALEQEAGMPVKLQGDFKYRPTWKFWRQVDGKKTQKILAGLTRDNFQAVGIYVDDKMVAAVKNDAAAQKVLDQLLNTYNQDGDREVSFKQKVTQKAVMIAGSELMSAPEALERIRFGGEKARLYEIKEGDTLWDVALAARVPVEDLLAANPDLNPDNMQIGEVVHIAKSCPLVDVITAYQDTRKEEIPYKVQEKEDSDLFVGERKLLQEGRPGEKEVTYDIALENGVEIKKKVVRQEIISQPQHQIVAKGERKLLASRGSGRLAYPAPGGVNSSYGSRHGGFHTGVDLGAAMGSPIVAAESGTVIRAGYQGSYGLCVDISHGSGVVTRYAHLSSLGVKAGQRVERSQFIGRAGSTGNSTGPHLHFEVIVNGSHKNPMQFI